MDSTGRGSRLRTRASGPLSDCVKPVRPHKFYGLALQPGQAIAADRWRSILLVSVLLVIVLIGTVLIVTVLIVTVLIARICVLGIRLLLGDRQ